MFKDKKVYLVCVKLTSYVHDEISYICRPENILCTTNSKLKVRFNFKLSGFADVYNEHGAVHQRPSLLQVVQRKHSFRHCQSWAVITNILQNVVSSFLQFCNKSIFLVINPFLLILTFAFC
jgi:hypothetical protein